MFGRWRKGSFRGVFWLDVVGLKADIQIIPVGIGEPTQVAEFVPFLGQSVVTMELVPVAGDTAQLALRTPGGNTGRVHMANTGPAIAVGPGSFANTGVVGRDTTPQIQTWVVDGTAPMRICRSRSPRVIVRAPLGTVVRY